MVELPSELVMDNDKATRGLIFTPELEIDLPFLPEAFEAVDGIQNRNRAAYLKELDGAVFSFKHRLGKVACAALWNNARPGSDEAIVTWSPFTDCAPHSRSTTISEYSFMRSANHLDIVQAKPNSWRQIIKAATVNDLENVLGAGKVVMAFFSDTPLSVYSAKGRQAIKQGDFGEAAEILKHGLAVVQDRLHGQSSETQITRLHIFGASQGANQAIASTSRIEREQSKLKVETLTIQEPILAVNGLKDLMGRWRVQRVGEASKFDARGLVKIPEPGLLHDIDRHGNEPAMAWRIAQATLLRAANMRGIASSAAINQIDNVLNMNVPVTALVAANSALTHDTPAALKRYYGNEVPVVSIKAVKGQFADHLADENVNVVATGIALGTRR